MEKEFKVGKKVLIEAEIRRIDDTSNSFSIYAGESCGFAWINNNLIKHAEKPFEPREMLVWDNCEQNAKKEKVIGVFDNKFLVKDKFSKIISYRYAKELPKTLENGKVYRLKNTREILYRTGNQSGFGFDDKEFINSETVYFDNTLHWQEYPLEDFKKLLIAEAEKRGFKSGVWVGREWKDIKEKCKFIYSNSIHFTITEKDFFVEMNDTEIFKNGVFAKIID